MLLVASGNATMAHALTRGLETRVSMSKHGRWPCGGLVSPVKFGSSAGHQAARAGEGSYRTRLYNGVFPEAPR